MSATLFTNVSIFDGTGSQPYPGEVKVEGNRITAVAKGADAKLARDGARVIDAGGMTLMPGMIESHSHLCFTSSVDRIEREWMPVPERHQFIATHNAKTLLDHGFTGAYSGGATRPAIEVALRDEIKAGYVPGPRLRASSFERNASGERLEFGPQIEEAKKFAQDMIDLGVDSMKMVLDGRGATVVDKWHILNYEDQELEVISRMAHDAGVDLSCHSYMPTTLKLAAKHDFHIIYHANFADDETIDAISAKADTIFVGPCVGVLLADAYDRFPTREEAEKVGAFEMLAGQTRVIPQLKKNGVRIVPGGDYGFPHNPHGRNARDIELFVTQFGFTPAEALVSATKWGGELMHMGDELGQIKPGYLADILLIDGNPLQNLKILQDRNKIALIMQDGKIYKDLAVAEEPMCIAAE